VLIGVIALLVIGPERLPSVARSVGLWVGKMQRFVAGVKSDIQNELNTAEVRKLLDSQEDQIKELKEMVNEARSDLERTTRDASSELSKGMNQAVGQVRDAAETVSENNQALLKDAKSADSSAESQQETSPDSTATPKPNSGSA